MRLIDADALMEKMKRRKEYVGRPSDPVCLVEDAPTIDAVPVVRCKDCKYCIKEPNGELYCDILAEGYEPLGSKKVNADWFCADGVANDINVLGKESLDTEQKTAGTNEIPLKW